MPNMTTERLQMKLKRYVKSRKVIVWRYKGLTEASNEKELSYRWRERA
jgi:hypothetical protein